MKRFIYAASTLALTASLVGCGGVQPTSLPHSEAEEELKGEIESNFEYKKPFKFALGEYTVTNIRAIKPTAKTPDLDPELPKECVVISLRYKALEDSQVSLFPGSALVLFDEQGTDCQVDHALDSIDQPSDISDDFSDVKVNDNKQHRAGSSYDYDVVFDCEFSNGQTFELTRNDYNPSNSNPGFKFKFDQGDANKLVILK